MSPIGEPESWTRSELLAEYKEALATIQGLSDALARIKRTPASWRKSETSKAGAEDVKTRVGPQSLKILRKYKEAGTLGLTAYEAGNAAGLLHSCYWKRVSELRQQYMIKTMYAADGKPVTRVNPKTRSSQEVKVITTAGRDWVARHAAR